MLLVLALLAAPALIGFSRDDAFVAWLDHGISEGKGTAWAKVTIVDAVKNAEATRPVEVELEPGEQNTEENAAARARTAAAEAQKKLGVGAWEPGRDVQFDARGGIFDSAGTRLGHVNLVLGKSSTAGCVEPFKSRTVKLVLGLIGIDGERTLFNSALCTTGCKLDRVVAHGRTLAVTAHCDKPGFEGSETRFILGAAMLPRALLDAKPR